MVEIIENITNTLDFIFEALFTMVWAESDTSVEIAVCFKAFWKFLLHREKCAVSISYLSRSLTVSVFLFLFLFIIIIIQPNFSSLQSTHQFPSLPQSHPVAMGNWLNKEPPPPMVLVPPLFDYPPLAARTRYIYIYTSSPVYMIRRNMGYGVYACLQCLVVLSVVDFWGFLVFMFCKLQCRMLESSYNLLFGKLALKCLFDDYFDEARHFSTVIMLKPIDDPHVDLVATVSPPFESISYQCHFLENHYLLLHWVYVYFCKGSWFSA